MKVGYENYIFESMILDPYFDSVKDTIQMIGLRGQVDSFIMVMPFQGNQSKFYIPQSVGNQQFIIQNTDIREADKIARLVFDYYNDLVYKRLDLPLDVLTDVALRSIMIAKSTALSDPIYIGNQGDGNEQYSINFSMQIQEEF